MGFREFSLIQPSLPPSLEISETPCITDALAKPFSLISFLSNLIFEL